MSVYCYYSANLVILVLGNVALVKQLAVEYESNAMIVKVDTDDEYEFARDMQVNSYSHLLFFFSSVCSQHINVIR